MEAKKIFDYVLELPTYNSLDYKAVEDYYKNVYDGWEIGCTSIAKDIGNGELIFGRNMDLYISNKSAYVIRTKVPGDYATVGLAYPFKGCPDYDEVIKNGLEDNLAKLIPFICTDVLNEKGLYIETNMRNGEYWPNGNSRYGCYGTNPDSEIRVCSMILPRYLGQKCSNVNEAVEVAKALNIYTPYAKGMDWNFCFMLGDSSGNYGVLEIANDKVSWLPKEPVQTNFYITKEFQEIEKSPCGVGRYEFVMNNYKDIKDEEDMYKIVNKICYSKTYDIDNSEFDVRTEFIAVKDNWSYDYLMDEKNQQEIIDYIHNDFKEKMSKDRKTLQNESKYWESAFTEILNLKKMTWVVRFFEDNEKVCDLSIKETRAARWEKI